MLLDFADHHLLVFADLQFGEAVGWTFESHSGKSHSWIDHVLISSSIASVVSEVCTLDCVSNFSDHRPILARCDLHLGRLATTTELPSKCGSLIVWDNACNEHLQRYSRLVCQWLDDFTLPDSIVYCTNPSCQNHQQTLDAYCNAIYECLIHSAKDCIPVHQCRRVAAWVEWFS